MMLRMPRRYEQRRRAEKQDETRQRIVDAAVGLHREIGPARTTMSAVAAQAGVQRNTLYRHFPDERSLLLACSAQHADDTPLPSTDAWLEIADPVARCRHGLAELYGHFESDEQMMAQVTRDAEVHPLVGEVSRLRFGGPFAAIREALLTAWPEAQRSPEVAASVDLAVSFRSWQTLVRGSGMGGRAAADLMADAIASAARRT